MTLHADIRLFQLTWATGNDNVNLHRAGIDLAIYFDDVPSAQLTHNFLMDEEILQVLGPEYAHRHDLTNTVLNSRHRTPFHDRHGSKRLRYGMNGIVGRNTSG